MCMYITAIILEYHCIMIERKKVLHVDFKCFMRTYILQYNRMSLTICLVINFIILFNLFTSQLLPIIHFTITSFLSLTTSLNPHN